MDEEQQPLEGQDAFDEAFNTIIEGDAGNEPDNTEPTGDEQIDQGADAPETEEQASESTPEEPAGTPADEPEQEAPFDARAHIQALEAQIAALKDSAKAPVAQQVPEPAPEPEPPVYSPEEEEFVKKYREDWEDVHKGEQLLRRAEYKELVGYIFNQIHAAYGPVIDYVTQFSGKDQYNSIKSLVDDYDDVRDKAIDWIETQPAFLQPAYKKVITEGSPEEVAQFIDMYKTATGNNTQSAPITPPQQPSQQAPAVKKAASALRVVSSRRGSAGSATDPNDFDAAFDEFARRR